jgi:hypothetical protein
MSYKRKALEAGKLGYKEIPRRRFGKSGKQNRKTMLGV